MKKLILATTIVSVFLCSTVYADSSTEDVQKKLDVTVLPAKEGEVCVFITNNSDTVIDELSVQVNYKDKSGNVIDLEEDAHDMVVPRSTVVSSLDSPDTYSDYEVTTEIELGVNPDYENHVKDIEINSNQGEDCIILEITNNSEVTIDEIEYIVVFYDGDNISDVSHSADIYDVKPDKKVVEKVSAYGIKYDKFEVYLNQAHTFGI